MLASEMYRASRSMEAVENYVVADLFSSKDFEEIAGESVNPDPSSQYRYTDEDFWYFVLREPQKYWDTQFQLSDFTLCS